MSNNNNDKIESKNNSDIHHEHEAAPDNKRWDRFSNWIHCICIVTFDLELGQTLEVCILKIKLTSAFNLFTFYRAYIQDILY